MTKLMLYSLLFGALFSCEVSAQLTAEQQFASAKGIRLYQQSAWDSAQPFLKIGAEAGDDQAQYYLGEAIRLNNMYMTSEARTWYEAAATQGNLYAMLRLSNSDDLCIIIGTCQGNTADQWGKRALEIARQQAETGDTEAMVIMYRMGKGLSWLEKAAEKGNANAQHLLAIAYTNGYGFFLISSNRDKAIERWAKSAAEAGFAPAMDLYANFLFDRKRSNHEIAYWLKKAGETGHLDALSAYALYTAHLPEGLGYPLNLPEAYGITYLISQLTGGGVAPEDARRNLPRIAEKMTPEQIQQGIAYADEWEKNHPPLSYYPPIYGY